MRDKKSGPYQLNLFTRRDFILTIGSLFIFSLLGLRLLAGLYFKRFTNAHHLTELSKVSKNTLIALYPIMTAEEDPKSIKSGIKEINRYLAALSFRTKLELELALLFFNQATLLTGNLLPFPYLDLEQKIKYINYLASGPRLFAPIFLGLKETCFLGFYSLERNFSLINNYTPIVSKMGDPDPEFNQEYQRLEYK